MPASTASSAAVATAGRLGQPPIARLSLKNASRSGSRPRSRPISARIASMAAGS
ncbi:hypothetical protein [Thermocatellispora tengchongensis]|uniref:hypothetical protein n=1 Tax=Thermocatellispora tengchongensis TaxID=1073253 RepID=UPI00363C5413